MSQYYNPYIIIPLVTWAVAQVLKFLIKAVRGNFDWRYLYASGGMPSVHSAAICALAVTAWAYGGFNSAAFGIAAVLAAVVMYDSFGVRRAAGDQAVAINDILKSLGKRPDLEQTRLREVLGHRPSEVISGAAVGILISVLLTFTHWENKIELLAKAPPAYERLIFLIVFATFIAVGIIITKLLDSRLNQTKTIKSVRKFVLTSLAGFGLAGLLTSLMQFQAVGVGEWRLWSLLLLFAAVAVYGLSWYYWLRFVPNRYKNELALKKHR